MASTDFDRLFDPDAIALVGASADQNKLSGRPLRYLEQFGYDGDLYLVNPGRDEIDGRPCYDSVTEIPGHVDVALVLVPARLTADVVAECGAAGIPFAAVIASGFREVGDEGAALEAELREVAAEADVRLVGPNSEGFVNIPGNVAATFSSICKRESFLPGSVGFVSQSGAFGGAVFQLVQNRGVGASKWITTGNEADVDTLDLLAYYVEDPATSVVAAYIESLPEGRRLLEIGRRAAETGTTIVGLRVGASEQGRDATASHTGSVASDAAVYEAMFDAAGVVSVDTVESFADTIDAFDALDVDRFRSPTDGVGVVSISGGAAALIADTCARLDLPMAELNDDTVTTIAERIPPYGSPTNPVDVTAAAIGEPEVFEQCVDAIGTDPGVDCVLFQFGNSGPETIDTCEEAICSLATEHHLPVATVFTGAEPDRDTRERLRDRGVLSFADPARALATLNHIRGRTADGERLRAQPADRYAMPDERHTLDIGTWTDAVGLFEEFDIPTPSGGIVSDAEAAVDLATGFDGPAVLKLDPIAVPHKSELGGVETGLETPAEVRAAFDRLSGIDVEAGILCQESIDGVELIIGAIQDDDFGPVLTVGPGGVFVELFDDAFSYRPLPVDAATAREMIDESAASRLVDGYRDFPPVDRTALSELIANISSLYAAIDVTELEFNPVIGTPAGGVAVDALLE
ncbi:MAG: acetate--CoA ligase family protein [Salinirussus sp.]